MNFSRLHTFPCLNKQTKTAFFSAFHDIFLGFLCQNIKTNKQKIFKHDEVEKEDNKKRRDQ